MRISVTFCSLCLMNLDLIFDFFAFLVPTQKMPRLLSTSASACRRLLAKAELMGIDVAALEFQEAQVNPFSIYVIP